MDADYKQRTLLQPPPPPSSLPEIELWKFDQGLNLKSARLFLHFNSNLRDGERGNQGGIFIVRDEKELWQNGVVFPVNILNVALAVPNAGLRNMFPTHAHLGEADCLHSIVAAGCDHTVWKIAHNEDDEMVNIVAVLAVI